MHHDPFGTLKVWSLMALNFAGQYIFQHNTLQTALLLLSIGYTLLRIKNELKNSKK